MLKPVEILSGCLQQGMTPLLPLKHMLGHFWRKGLWQAFPSQNFFQAQGEHVDSFDRIPEIVAEIRVPGVQISLLIVADFLQALSHEEKATLNSGSTQSGVLLDLELREARGPSAEVLTVGFVLKKGAHGVCLTLNNELK